MKHSLSFLRPASRSAMVLCGVALAAATASGQTVFSSGSTGADGPLAFTAPFPDDPPVEYFIDTSAKPDGIWNYTTIDIPARVKVSFTKNAANTGVIWLATGDVNIAGEINLDGANGTTNVARGNEAPGGPGGFRGGRGGRRSDVSGSSAGTPGEGPGGGAAGEEQSGGGGGQYGTAGSGGLSQPLLGGSGGGGSGSVSGIDGANGGGGGGATLVASSTTIRVSGSIHSRGGAAGPSVCYDCGMVCCLSGGGGSGGAIRLVANRIEGSGSIAAVGGSGAGPGRIKTEAFDFQLFTNLTNPIATEDRPVPLSFTNPGSIRITSIAGQVVPVPPGGNTASPDVIFSEPGQITVNLATTNIPQNTKLTVRVATDGQVIKQDTRTDASGNASATLTVPAGFGTIQAYAEYPVTP
jgi:hypothetical protein